MCAKRGQTPRALLSAIVVLGLTVPGLGQQSLTSRVQGVISGAKIGKAKVAVSVRDLDLGQDLVDIDAEAPMKPASNLKLLTSGTALLVLGPDFAFKTEFVIDGAPGSERLIIRGGGDPALADPAILERMDNKPTVESLVETLASAVTKAGITRVTEVIIDDRIFDRQWIHPTWPKDQLDKWYCAPICGLNFHTNVLSAFPAPSPDGIGRPPIVLLEPAATWLEIENKARTVDSGKNSFWMSRGPEGNRFTLFGEVRLATRQPLEITVADAPTLAGQVFAAELAKQGVTVGKGERSRDAAVRAVRLIDAGDTYQGRTVAVVSTHMTDVLDRCNGDSHNLYAEALIKRVGREVTGEPGSWTNGSSIVRMTIGQSSKLGPKYAASTVIADGSGLSRENRVTPGTFTRWLDEMQKDRKIGEVYMNSLATPEKRGNLRRRFQDTKLTCELAAKSGTINGVRCLSGYLTEPQTGRRLAFSIMINELDEGEGPDALQLHEKIIATIDRFVAAGKRAGAEAPK